MRLRFIFCVCLSFTVVFTSCVNFSGSLSGSESAKSFAGKESISVANWNVQTFFDSTTNGCEYSEFIGSKVWGKDAYVARVSRLCSVIKQLDADVFVMEELENEAQLYDISNFLAGEWNSHKIYSYGCFAKDEGSSIGCGVLSRHPLSDMKVHALGVQGESSVPRMRPLMELTVVKDGSELVLFVNHWKSMSGGAEESEVWRNKQEAVLSRRLEACVAEGKAVLAVGDFNRDINSFCVVSGGEGKKVLLRNFCDGAECSVAAAGSADVNGSEYGGASEYSLGSENTGVEVDSFWFHSDGTLVEPGSYYFRDVWSRIDQIFVCGSAVMSECIVCTEGPWCDSDTSVPKKYTVWNGSGYSDHLPIMCRVWF